MAVRGNWGDRMVIHIPVLYKRVSCATCKYYCHEDHSCLVTPIVPRIDGYDNWKTCKKFLLAREYIDDSHKKQVMRIKGDGFFEEIQVIDKKEINRITNCVIEEAPPDYVHKEPKTFADKFLAYAWMNNGIDFKEIPFPGYSEVDGSRCYVSARRKIVVMTISKIKRQKVKHHINKEHIRANIWSAFNNSLLSVIKTMDILNIPDDFDKWIIIPEIPYDEENSCGELFYYSRGKKLHGIKLVEMNDSGRLQFETGPICEKFWNKERIDEIEVFKV